ncbi:MAG: PAS domain S-box protein [Rubrivivax sp.]
MQDPALDPFASATLSEPALPVAGSGAAYKPRLSAALWIAALSCMAAALLLGAALWQQLDWHGVTLVTGFTAVGGSAAAATRLRPPLQSPALVAVLLAVTGLLGLVALWLGTGQSTPGLPVLGLLVCVLCAACGWRAGLLLALAAAGMLLGIGELARHPPLAAASLGTTGGLGNLALGGHLIGIAAGLAAGVLISQMMQRAVRAANDREMRFRSLLGLAADGYWEIDRDHRLMAAIDHHRPTVRTGAAQGIGNLPWELPQFGCDAHTLDELLADLDARVAFRDRRIRWTSNSGAVRHYLLSGAPRFDSRGTFTGFRGVARDVSDVEAAHAAVQATETRYQELFSLIPTPLVLHRRWLVLAANPAAVTLFAADDLGALLGSDLLANYEGGDSRERARRRSEALHAQPLGTALPVTDFKLRIGERTVAVRATSVSVHAEGGPALLSIFVDDTERLAAEQAVRRSEAMLSHLVATSPDLITLSELATGRYVMVNRSFERITGWSAADAVGRTSMELGVWRDTEDRQRVVDAMRGAGTIDSLPTTIIERGGRAVSMLISAARFVMDRREYLVINGRDITESERDRLQRKAILANASIGIAVTREGRIVLANRHFESMFGFDESEPLGYPMDRIWQGGPATAIATATAPIEGQPVLAGLAELADDAGIETALARGEPVEVERRAHRKDGGALTVRLRGRAIDPQRPQNSDTVWILEDITERREFEQTLAHARDAAEAANRAKTAFLANTSHELRTPLNGLIGLARMASADDIDDARRTQYLTQIVDCAQSLAAIISDILDLSKIEAGRLMVERTAFGLGDALRSLHALFAPQAAARQLDQQLHLAEGIDAPVMGDPLRLRQVVANYLGNAIKFTHTGHIVLSARRLVAPDDAMVRIEVVDSGPGIDAVTLPRLFKPFTQADESITRRYGGTGLGLSICHELAVLMGGLVGVQSSLGEGSTFWIELPLPLARTGSIPVPVAFDPSGLAGAHVLLVEDNPVNMLVGVSMLERWGVRVAQAHNGMQAVQAVQAAATAGDAFEFVLMDVQMPVMGGHEAAQTLRATDAGRDLPIIALTAAAMISEREEALRCGMNDFLTKPIDAQKLHAALMRWRRADHPPSASTEHRSP